MNIPPAIAGAAVIITGASTAAAFMYRRAYRDADARVNVIARASLALIHACGWEQHENPEVRDAIKRLRAEVLDEPKELDE